MLIGTEKIYIMHGKEPHAGSCHLFELYVGSLQLRILSVAFVFDCFCASNVC